MDPSRFASFVVVDLMLVMTPGADWAYAITAGVRGGRLVPAIAGLAGVLTYLGAAYLLWLGVRVARDPAPLAAENSSAVSALRGSTELRDR
jgi:threonine/homoserine/homoserine lactone efflux protein